MAGGEFRSKSYYLVSSVGEEADLPDDCNNTLVSKYRWCLGSATRNAYVRAMGTRRRRRRLVGMVAAQGGTQTAFGRCWPSGNFCVRFMYKCFTSCCRFIFTQTYSANRYYNRPLLIGSSWSRQRPLQIMLWRWGRCAGAAASTIAWTSATGGGYEATPWTSSPTPSWGHFLIEFI